MNNTMLAYRSKLINKAKVGDTKAQCCLGWMYMNGRGEVNQNYPEASKWYGMAAANGCRNAQEALAKLAQLQTVCPPVKKQTQGYRLF